MGKEKLSPREAFMKKLRYNRERSLPVHLVMPSDETARVVNPKVEEVLKAQENTVTPSEVTLKDEKAKENYNRATEALGIDPKMQQESINPTSVNPYFEGTDEAGKYSLMPEYERQARNQNQTRQDVASLVNQGWTVKDDVSEMKWTSTGMG